MDIKQPKDAGFLNDFEKKHIPEIKISTKPTAKGMRKVKITLGEMPHPMIPEHYIKWVAIYRGEELIKKQNLAAVEATAVELVLPLTAGGYRCLAACSIHGVWEKVFTLK